MGATEEKEPGREVEVGVLQTLPHAQHLWRDTCRLDGEAAGRREGAAPACSGPGLKGRLGPAPLLSEPGCVGLGKLFSLSVSCSLE